MRALVAMVLTVFLFLLGAAAQGAHLYVLLNLKIFVMIGGPLAVFLIYSQGFVGTVSLLKRVFSNQATDGDVHCVRGLVTLGFILGGMGTVVGVVITMGLLDQGTEVIGHAIGGSFVSAIYGGLPGLLLLPLSKKPAIAVSMIKAAAAYSGFVLTSSLGIFSFAMWILKT